MGIDAVPTVGMENADPVAEPASAGKIARGAAGINIGDCSARSGIYGCSGRCAEVGPSMPRIVSVVIRRGGWDGGAVISHINIREVWRMPMIHPIVDSGTIRQGVAIFDLRRSSRRQGCDGEQTKTHGCEQRCISFHGKLLFWFLKNRPHYNK